METETIQNPWDIDTGKLTSEHEESMVFPQRKKKRDVVWHVITNETGETAKAHTVFMSSSMRHVSWVVLARSRGGRSWAPDRDCSIAVEAVEGSQWARDRGRGALRVGPLHLQRRAGLEQRIASRHVLRCFRCSTCSRGEPRSYRPYRGHTTIHVP
jgi:hypothetical protein